jgi:hypothetical protein
MLHSPSAAYIYFSFLAWRWGRGVGNSLSLGTPEEEKLFEVGLRRALTLMRRPGVVVGVDCFAKNRKTKQNGCLLLWT